MKTMFIPALLHEKLDKKLASRLVRELPDKVALVYSIQYKNMANELKVLLGKKVCYFSQVLGCSKPKLPKNTETVLLIGEAKFHGIGLALETKLPVYVYNNKQLTKILDKDIAKLKQKNKGMMLKFHNSKKIGILISTKPGQFRLKQVQSLKSKYPKKGFFLFVTNNINKQEFENFPDIQCWVNTACPRLDMDLNTININRL